MVTAAELSTAARPIVVELGDARTLEVCAGPQSAVLRVRSPVPGERIELELCFTAAGPVVRTRAAALELDATAEIVARCQRFAVEATGDIDLSAGGELKLRSQDAATLESRSFTVDASPGAIRLRANDDVQLMGELILLNCERLPPMPPWTPEPRQQLASLPPNAVSGDPAIIAELLAARVAPGADP